MKRMMMVLLVLLAVLTAAVMPVYAAQEHIADQGDILTGSEEQALEQLAREVSDRIGSDVHILITEDFYDEFGWISIMKCAEEYFTTQDLGRGEEREGILLLLSMKYRDYALIFHGKQTLGIFSEDRQISLEEDFLDDFSRNDWYGGLEDFLNGCVREERMHRTSRVLIVLLVPLAVAAIACALMAVGMKTARSKAYASYYIPGGGVRVIQSSDRFVNKTVVRRRIEKSSSGGGHGHSSGGFSGRSGKF